MKSAEVAQPVETAAGIVHLRYGGELRRTEGSVGVRQDHVEAAIARREEIGDAVVVEIGDPYGTALRFRDELRK